MRKRLKRERKKHGWTQLYVATSVGVTERTYQYYESGQHEPSFTIANKLEDLFEVPQRELLEDYTPETVTEGR